MEITEVWTVTSFFWALFALFNFFDAAKTMWVFRSKRDRLHGTRMGKFIVGNVVRTTLAFMAFVMFVFVGAYVLFVDKPHNPTLFYVPMIAANFFFGIASSYSFIERHAIENTPPDKT